MIVRRRLAILAAGVAMATVSCATGSDTSTSDDADEAPTPTSADVIDTTVAAPADPDTDEPTADEAPTDSAVATDVSEREAESEEGESEEEVAPSVDSTDDVVVEEQPAPQRALAEVGGRSFAESVEPESRFDANPFPDLVVDDVGRETKANLANILPSDRPILLWTWAPH